jgi:transcriptional antiterminator RfaH
MPILAAEPMVYPDCLFAESQADQPVGRSASALWWVAHTKPRQEKALARHLRTNEVSYFLPQFEKTIRRQRNLFRSWNLLFPGYVFVLGDDEGRGEALKSNRIAGLLAVPEQDELELDLQRVHRIVCSNLPLFPEDRLVNGTRVRMVHGPLKGLQGVIEERRGQHRFVVTVSFIQQGVSAEVEARDIEPLLDDASIGEPSRASA